MKHHKNALERSANRVPLICSDKLDAEIICQRPGKQRGSSRNCWEYLWPTKIFSEIIRLDFCFSTRNKNNCCLAAVCLHSRWSCSLQQCVCKTHMWWRLWGNFMKYIWVFLQNIMVSQRTWPLTLNVLSYWAWWTFVVMSIWILELWPKTCFMRLQWSLTAGILSLHPWFQVDVCAKWNEIPLRQSWDIMGRTGGWTLWMYSRVDNLKT